MEVKKPNDTTLQKFGVLDRSQLKEILGGVGGGGESIQCPEAYHYCTCNGVTICTPSVLECWSTC